MKLYAIVGSPNSRKVLAVAHHTGIDVDIEYLDLFEGDTKKPDYMALNPNAPLLFRAIERLVRGRDQSGWFHVSSFRPG